MHHPLHARETAGKVCRFGAVARTGSVRCNSGLLSTCGPPVTSRRRLSFSSLLYNQRQDSSTLQPDYSGGVDSNNDDLLPILVCPDSASSPRHGRSLAVDSRSPPGITQHAVSPLRPHLAGWQTRGSSNSTRAVAQMDSRTGLAWPL